MRGYQRRLEDTDRLLANHARNVIVPAKGVRKKIPKLDDLLLYRKRTGRAQKPIETRQTEYEEIMRHVRGKGGKLGRGVKSEKTIREVIQEKRAAERKHRTERGVPERGGE